MAGLLALLNYDDCFNMLLCVNWVLMPAIGASEWRSGISAAEVEREKLVRRSHDEDYLASMVNVDMIIDE